ncbi:hypothetical protein HDV04_002115 [Boothiomyces sp. JEL0838]|nr:hypothetical protein HDV04_002115 [Boothiomyces sp. JEL0838]
MDRDRHRDRREDRYSSRDVRRDDYRERDRDRDYRRREDRHSSRDYDRDRKRSRDDYHSSRRKERHSEPERQPEIKHHDSPVSDEEREGRPPKRKTRWGSVHDKVNIPGLPTSLPSDLTNEQIDNYIIHMRIEELGRRLRLGDYVPNEKRSVSPEPTYGPDGRRDNTRDLRYRKILEDERHALVELGMRTIIGFRPPADYKRPSKLAEKVYIPLKDYPDINFIGLLIGPRGNTLKKMETETGTKISIRGKGSVKEGKARLDTSGQQGEEEDLHALVSGDTEDRVKAAIVMINKIIETATSVPEGHNELKRNQLRELAALNGTLRDDENQICTNCGGVGHRRFECTEAANFTATLVCRICNSVGHLARDCLYKNDPNVLQAANQRDQKLDDEYANLMAELGGTNTYAIPTAPFLGPETVPSSWNASASIGAGGPYGFVQNAQAPNWNQTAGAILPGEQPPAPPPPAQEN